MQEVFSEISFQTIEKKWQTEWEKAKIFEAKEKGKKFYCLEMFPYPSAEGLHMGHAFNYIIADIYARFMRMRGFNVLYPVGYDAFGLPAENAAIKAGTHPKLYTEKAILNFIAQQKALGLSYDWSRIVKTSDPDFYKWDQWIFLKLFEKGLAYKKISSVNWCPKCNTALANEQVHGGRCWRHEDTEVQLKQLEQWFFKITDYAKKLYEDIDKLKEWPEDVRAMQRNWIGKSQGVNINFSVNGKPWPIFTTRPDTIYGVTFMVISATHPKLMELVTQEQKQKVEAFLKKLPKLKTEELEKEGVFTGSYAVNPITKEKIPIWAGNFVLAEYGSGMVMAVPAHDQRDFEFAKKYKLPIKIVIQPKEKKLNEKTLDKAYVEEGFLVNSGNFSGMNNVEAIQKISDYIEKHKLGKRAVQYRLKDWLVSRQRYWGTPIPVIYCAKCGIVPVPEKELPVLLPEKVKFGSGNPLETNKEFVNTRCPICKSKAKRETDTMDTFVNSSWYFLRYCDPKNSKKIFDKSKVDYWMPIDLYIGGKEHACMHLIYFRFYTKFLHELGLVKIEEPAVKLFNQGMIHGSDGAVMSKSRGNIVNPIDMIQKYSADTLRLYLVSMASPNKDFAWNDNAIEGSYKFLKQVFYYFNNVEIGKSDPKVESKFNKTIKEVTEDIEKLHYNLAIIKIRQLFDYLGKKESKEILEGFLKLFAPFCPHIAEELWHKLGNKSFISVEKWPIADERKIIAELEKQEQQIRTTINDIKNILRIIKEKQKIEAKKVYLYTIQKELEIYKEAQKSIEEALGIKVEIFANNDPKRYDPQNKAERAKLGKPALYIE